MTEVSSILKPRRFWPLLIIAAGLIVYANSFTGGYVLDDFGSIPENPTIRRLWPIWQPLSPPHRGGLTVEGRPLINLSLAINYALGEYNVWGYHALNLAVHILAGLTLFGIVRRTLLQARLRERFGAAASELALATAILWTVHPLQTESVTYIVQRAESIMGLFYLLTLYCFIRGSMANGALALQKSWYALSVLACALGMASKEVMMTAPLMVLLYDRTFLAGSFREAWRRRRLVYLGLSATWILLGLLLISGQIPATSTIAQRIGRAWWQYLATEPGVILYYLRLCVWPHPLQIEYRWPIAENWIRILGPTIVLVILLGAVVWALKRNSAWGFVGGWFFLILAPSSSFVPLLDLIYEHRMYLSLAAVASLVVIGLYGLLGRRSWVVFGALAIGLGVLTWQRNQSYASNADFNLGVALQKAGRLQEGIDHYERALRAAPDDATAHFNLGTALQETGRLPEAIGHWEQALRIRPDFADAHLDLGAALAQMDRLDEAVQHYQQALRINPDFVGAYYYLGNAMVRMGKMQEAIRCYEQAVRLKPDFAEAYGDLGIALEQAGHVQEAIQQFERALQINPALPGARYKLGLAFERAGRVQDAIKQWERALRDKPDYVEALNRLGIALYRAGRIQEAIEHFKQALRFQPDYADAHNNLGTALLQQGQPQDAIQHYEQALQIEPNNAQTCFNLGNALFQTGRLREAIVQYQAALRINPDYGDAHSNLGAALFRSGRVGEAIEHFEQALRLAPGVAETHYNLGVALEQAGQLADAVKQYEQVLRLQPDSAEARNRLARLRAAP
jgi:tetratricopeptide (TPR) repeat protein